MNTIRNALILSAGFGTRLKPLTEHTPKALIEVGGKPMLQHCIELLKANNIDNIFINTHYLADKISNYITEHKLHPSIQLIYEPEILGTGGGILNIFRNHCSEPLLVLNCDCLFYRSNPIPELLKGWNASTMDFLALLSPLRNDEKPKRKGDFSLDVNGNLVRKNNTQMDYIFVGCYIVAPTLYSNQSLEFFPITDLLFKFNKRYFGLVSKHEWFDIGTHQSLKLANKMIKQQ